MSVIACIGYDGLGDRQIVTNLISFLAKHNALSEVFYAQCRRKTAAKGSTIIEQGQDGQSLYILVQGTAKVVSYSEGGHEIWFAELGPGASFGEMAVLLDAARTSSVIAETDCQFDIISAASVSDIMAKFPAFSHFMAQLMAQRLQETTRALFESLSYNVSRRLYESLLRRAAASDEKGEVKILTPAPTVTELSGQLNLSREATSRALSQLIKKGLVIKSKDAWSIIQPEFRD